MTTLDELNEAISEDESALWTLLRSKPVDHPEVEALTARVHDLKAKRRRVLAGLPADDAEVPPID
jgi:hypothetical protein